MKAARIVAAALATLLAASTTPTARETRPGDVVVVLDGSGSSEKATELTSGGEEPVVRALTTPVDGDEDTLECEGDGLIHVVRDECMHDGGKTAVGDSLEVYCYLGTARFCLSGEECPWREAPATGGDKTCSRAGLDTEWMATAWCEGWSHFDYYACTELGQIKLEHRR